MVFVAGVRLTFQPNLLAMRLIIDPSQLALFQLF